MDQCLEYPKLGIALLQEVIINNAIFILFPNLGLRTFTLSDIEKSEKTKLKALVWSPNII